MNMRVVCIAFICVLSVVSPRAVDARDKISRKHIRPTPTLQPVMIPSVTPIPTVLPTNAPSFSVFPRINYIYPSVTPIASQTPTKPQDSDVPTPTMEIIQLDRLSVYTPPKARIRWNPFHWWFMTPLTYIFGYVLGWS